MPDEVHVASTSRIAEHPYTIRIDQDKMASLANNWTPQQEQRRRGNSSYEVRIESPTYPIEQQIQLYKFKPVPFNGESIAKTDYVKHNLQQNHQPAKPKSIMPPHIPFSGTSTSRSDFVKHENVEARQSVHAVPAYVPSYSTTPSYHIIRNLNLSTTS